LKSFTRDYLRLLVRLIFCHETKTIHKHILFLFQKFSAAASAASVENSEDVRSMILNEFLSELLVYSNQMLQTSASIEKLEDDLRQFEWLYELDGFFHCELVKLVPQFLSKSYQCLSHHSKLFFTSSNNQQSLFVIGNILKTTVLIITEHLDAITNELTQNMQQNGKNNNSNGDDHSTPSIFMSLQQIMDHLVVPLLSNVNASRDVSRVCCLFLYKLLQITFSLKDENQLVPFFAVTMFDSSVQEEDNTNNDYFTRIVMNHEEKQMRKLVSLLSAMSRIAALGAFFNIFNAKLTMQTIQSSNFSLDLVVPDLIQYAEGKTKNSREQLFSIQMLQNALVDMKHYLSKNKTSINETDRNKFTSTLTHLMNVVWNNWENPTNNIYDKVRDLFESALEVHDALVSLDKSAGINLDLMTKHLLDLDFNRKGKYFPLLKILPRIGSTKFYELCPNVLEMILSAIGNGMVNTQASLLYENFVKDQFAIHGITKKNIDKIESVQKLTLLPVCKYLSGEAISVHETNHASILIYIVPKVIKLHPSNFAFLIQNVRSNESGNYSDAFLRAVIQLLIIGKSESIPNIDDHVQQRLSIIDVCFKHFDPKLRLDALNLTTSSNRLSDPCTPQQLKTVIDFVRLNLKPPSSSFRHELTAILKRFLARVSSSCQNIWTKFERDQSSDKLKDAVDNMKKNKSTQVTQDVECFAHMIHFIHDFFFFLQRAFYGGCPHEKLLTALTLYQTSYSMLHNQPFIAHFPTYFSSLHSQGLTTQLLNLFVDCWDKVRSLIFDLLLLLDDGDYLKGREFITHLVTRSIELCSSGRLRESDAGALLLNVVFAKFVVRNHMKIEWSYDSDNKIQVHIENSNDDAVLVFLHNLLSEFERRITNIQTDIFRICTDSSVTGTLLSLRYTFSNFKLASAITESNRAQWQDFGAKLFRLCDGLLCESLQMVGSKKDVDCRGHIHMPNNPLNHSLTVNSWLSVKEVTATLGTFTEHVPLTNIDPIFSEEQFSKLGELFLKVLLHCKHNGAIEKSQVGFALTCKRLLSCDLPNLAKLPSNWLQYLIDRIATSDDKNSILRRSAGVPFCFMGILRSEPQGVPRVLLPHAMNSLMAITETYYSNGCGEHTMVHALNVMRFIFQDSTLAGDVTQYIEKGFITVLKGFTDPSWAVRNSSLMCYTALITRSIGNRRTKDDYATQNTVTSREFFSRYPLLKQYLLDQLRIGTSQSSELHPTLYPSLLLLSRLRAASSISDDASDNAGDVSSFVPYVMECSAQNHYLIRSMAARALVPLIPSTLVPSFVPSLISNIADVAANKTQNALHGLLLQILQFGSMADSSSEQEMISLWLVKFYEAVTQSGLLKAGPRNYFVARTVTFDIFCTLLSKVDINTSLPLYYIVEIVNLADMYISRGVECGDFEGIGFVECQAEATRFALLGFARCASSEDVSDDFYLFVEKCLAHSNQKVRTSAFKFITNLATKQPNNTLFQTVGPKLLLTLINHVLYKETPHDANCVRFGLQALQNVVLCINPTVDALSSVDHDQTWSRLLEIHSSTQNCYIKEQIIILLGALAPILAISSADMLHEWSKLVEEDSYPFQADNLRLAAQSSILHSNVLINAGALSNKDLFRIMNACVRLLQDEEENIRQATTAMLSPSKKQQVDTVLQDTFLSMTAKFANSDFYAHFLFNLIALEQDENGRPVVPFEEELTDDMPALFDKEEDNLFQEELFAVQLAAFHLKKTDISNERRLQMLDQLSKQLDHVCSLLSNAQVLFWIGDVSYHSSAFLTMYRLVLGIYTLSSENDSNRDKARSIIQGKYHNVLLNDVMTSRGSSDYLFTLGYLPNQQQ